MLGVNAYRGPSFTGLWSDVENKLGLVMAAAGVDASNTADGIVLLLPLDPDASAAAIRGAVEAAVPDADWWTPADVAAFEAAGKALVAQYDAYEVLPGEKLDGTFTLGENIGDLAGLTIAYDAYKKSLGGKEARAVRLMNAFGPKVHHAIVSAMPEETGAAAEIDRSISVTWPRKFPALKGSPTPGRLKLIAEAMRGYDLVLTYNWGAMDAVMAHPDLQGLRRFLLATSDAHGLYAHYGFTAIARAERFMERYRPDAYLG